MKRILLSVLVYGIYACSFAQDPIEPCCSIVVLDIKNNIVVARDITTGRLYQFRADALDMKAINLNDAVNISSGKVTSIGGTKRMYATVRPDDATPCCSVVSIQPDPVAPCCSLVLFKNNTTNSTFSIIVPKQIAATLKTGQAVSMDGATGMAIIQSSYGSSNGQMNSYGYSATSEDATTGNENATAKWVITPIPTMKGVLGRLNTSFPEGVDWTIDVRTAEDKFITNRSGSGKHSSSYDIAPGNYYFRLNTITVKDVPIEKGKETRLKAGYLSVISEGDWSLYDESKKKFHTSGSKPKKITLPVGNYQLKMGGQFFPLVVIDGETIEM